MVLLVYLLTALAALVVALTRVRLTRSNGATGATGVPRRLLDAHTVAGVLATVGWLVYLVAADDTTAGGDGVGIAALACWWVVSIVGLLVLARWLPSRGRHASARRLDGWGGGAWLSTLGHVGVLIAVVVFTWAYGAAAV